MKIAPVSGDLLVKLAVTAIAVGAAIYALRKASAAADAYGQAAADRIIALARQAADAVNPTSDQNLAYQGATWATSTLAGRAESPGTWIGGVLSGGDAKVQDMLSGNTGPVQAPATGQDASYMATGLPF